MSADKSAVAHAPAEVGRHGVRLQTVAACLLFVASLFPMITAMALSGNFSPKAAMSLVAGACVALVLSIIIASLLTRKLERMGSLMSSLAKTQSVESLLRTERELSQLGGARELRQSQFAMRKVLHGLIRASKSRQKS